jgi:PilZ domain
MPRKGDIRRHERVTQAAPVQVSWKDRLGNEKFANAEILDVSAAGMRVKVPESLAEHTFVTLRSDRLALHGRASVRSCVRQGAKYLVGLEFIGGLQWKPRSEK